MGTEKVTSRQEANRADSVIPPPQRRRNTYGRAWQRLSSGGPPLVLWEGYGFCLTETPPEFIPGYRAGKSHAVNSLSVSITTHTRVKQVVAELVVMLSRRC